jgi:D-aminopeptidase
VSGASGRRYQAAALLLAAFHLSGNETAMAQQAGPDARPRARDAGIIVGPFTPGEWNAITDVAGVRVGHVTLTEGEGIRTGVTAILPHGGDLFRDRVPAALHVVNGSGKLTGVTQLRELGELETPILLTCTLCVWRAADALVAWMLARPGMEEVRSINPVVGETNDGFLNDVRQRPLVPEHVVRAVEGAVAGPVAEGSVGAGTGTVAFGWKGGIGTSSRVLPEPLGGWTVGVLVQSNFGGSLTIAGAPVGRALGHFPYRRELEAGMQDGSIMIVVATDAPLDAGSLERLATRAVAGLARTGASLGHGSGDYAIAFSTAESVRRRGTPQAGAELRGDALTPLFLAVADATEEAIYNSLFRAATMRGHRGTVEALPLDRALAVIRGEHE